MLRQLRVSELRYRAVLEVLDGTTVTRVARRFVAVRVIGVSSHSVHLAADGGVVNLEDRSSRPYGVRIRTLTGQPSTRATRRANPRREAAPGVAPMERWACCKALHVPYSHPRVAVTRSSVYNLWIRHWRVGCQCSLRVCGAGTSRTRSGESTWVGARNNRFIRYVTRTDLQSVDT